MGRISNLPDVILEEITSLLPTKDCCRTQVLSTRRRPIWRTAPLNLDHRQISVLPEFDLLKAIISSHQQGPVQRLYISTRYLLSTPGMVDAWLTSPEFEKLQQFRLYHYHEPEHQEFLPTPSLSILCFSSSLHTATIAQCHLPDDLVQMLRLRLLKNFHLCWFICRRPHCTASSTPVALPSSAC